MKLWEPTSPEAGPEPFATLVYGDLEYEIPYTLIHWWSGWITMGADGSSVERHSHKTMRAFDSIMSKMLRDHEAATKPAVAV